MSTLNPKGNVCLFSQYMNIYRLVGVILVLKIFWDTSEPFSHLENCVIVHSGFFKVPYLSIAPLKSLVGQEL